MIALFIIIIMTIALIGAAGYGVMSLMDSSGIAMNIQRNAARMDVISTAIRANSRMENGRIIVPVAADLSARLNTSIAPFSKTTWGKDIVYCPVSSGDPIDVRKLVGGDYEVSTTKIGTQLYVTGGNVSNLSTAQALRDRNVIAMLISPDISSKSGDALPRCSDVTFKNEDFNVSGGDVTIVSDIQSNGMGFGRVFVIANGGGPVPPGAIAINSFESAASYIVNYGLPDATIKLSAEQVINYLEFQRLLDAVAGRTVRLQGSGSLLKIDYSGSAVSTDANVHVDGNFSLSGVSVRGYVNGTEAIDVVANVGPAGVLSLANSSIGGLRTVGGKAFLDVGASIVPAHSAAARAEPVIAFGGQIFAAANVTPVVSSPSAPIGMKAYGGDISIAGPIAMSLLANGKAFEASAGGRVTAASATASVSVNANPAIAVDAAMTMSDKVAASASGIKRNLITNGNVSCPDGSASCEAVCPDKSIIAWGECGSSNEQPLSTFGTNDTGTSWICRWSSPAAVVGPRVKAVCSALP